LGLLTIDIEEKREEVKDFVSTEPKPWYKKSGTIGAGEVKNSPKLDDVIDEHSFKNSQKTYIEIDKNI